MSGAVTLPFAIGLILALVSLPFFYAAFFWESAKTWISQVGIQRLEKFSRHPITKFGMLFLVLQTLVLSPFIEQHRWPFSYPSDPAVLTENNDLKNQINQKNGAIGREKELADKWRFSSALRDSGLNCQYLLEWTPKAASVAQFWRELFIATGWPGASKQVPIHQTEVKFLISISPKDDPASTQCAEVIQRQLSQLYSNPPSKILPRQQSNFLNSCDRNGCVEIEVDY